MGCSNSTTAIPTFTTTIPLIPRSKYATLKDEVRELYTIKQSITFNSNTALFHGEETNPTKDNIFIRISRIQPSILEKIAKRLDLFMENSEKFKNLLSYTKIAQTSHFLYYITKSALPAIFLIDSIITENYILSETSLFFSFCPIFTTVAQMHEQGLFHGQISPNKLVLINNICYLFDPLVGSELYGDRLNENYAFLSPEDLIGENPSFSSDVFALGSTLYYLITGHTVFASNSCDECIESSKKMNPSFEEPVWNLVSESLKDLIKKMLTRNKSDRIKMNEVLMHEWTQGHEIGLKDNKIENIEIIGIDYKRECCQQKTKFFLANDRIPLKVQEIHKILQSYDDSFTGYLQYSAIIQQCRNNDGTIVKCEDCDYFWQDPVHYNTFMTETEFLNLLIIHERLSVVFRQLAKKKEFIDEHDIQTMLNGIARFEYTMPGIFETLIHDCQNPQRIQNILRYEEFLIMCNTIQFVPTEGFIIAKFF